MANLHWLRPLEGVDYKLAVMAYDSLHGHPPSYFSSLRHVADLPGRHPLRSSTYGRLEVPAHRHVTIRRRSFPVVASILWNALPAHVQFAPSLPVSAEIRRHSSSGDRSRTLYNNHTDQYFSINFVHGLHNNVYYLSPVKNVIIIIITPNILSDSKRLNSKF
jgi:hypothetical protein